MKEVIDIGKLSDINFLFLGLFAYKKSLVLKPKSTNIHEQRKQRKRCFFGKDDECRRENKKIRRNLLKYKKDLR